MKLLIILLINITSLLALVSVAPVDIGDRPGTHVIGSVSLESKRGNTDRNNYQASARVTYDDAQDYVVWGEVAGEYGQSRHQKDTDNLYAHLRYISAIDLLPIYSNNLRAEYFGQIQRDEFKLIEERGLLGVGLRYKLFELLNSISPNVFRTSRGYLGAGGLYERIGYTSDDPIENNVRLNTYFAYVMEFSRDASFSYNFYYQPKINYFSDYAISNKFELKVKIFEKFFLSFNAYYDVDSIPPHSVETNDYGQKTNLIFEF